MFGWKISNVGGPWIIRHVTDNFLCTPGEWWDIGPLRIWRNV